MGNIDTRVSSEITTGLIVVAGNWATYMVDTFEKPLDNPIEVFDDLIYYFHQSYSRLLKYAQDENPPERNVGLGI